MRRNRKKEKMAENPILCIILLSVEIKTEFEDVEKKEDWQLRYITEYANANNLVPMKIIRKGCLVENMESISYGIADAYM